MKRKLFEDGADGSPVDSIQPVLAQRGQVFVGKLPGRFAKDPETGQGLKWPTRDGCFRVNVCSSAQGKWRQLSPMLLGPIPVKQYGWSKAQDYGELLHCVALPAEARRLENLWQFSKVWPGEEQEATLADGRVMRLPTHEFYERRAEGWQADKGVRHVKRGVGNVPLYMMHGNRKLSYIEARYAIYCRVYAALVVNTDAYRDLAQRVGRGESLLLVGYDGFDRGTRSFTELLDDPARPFGHEMVLAAMLSGERPWENREPPAALKYQP